MRVEALEVRVVMSASHTNPAMLSEHLAVFGLRDAATGIVTGGLVPSSAVNNYSIASGEWDDPATWSDGVPDDEDNVLISAGMVVTIDSDVSVSATDPRVALRTVRVDGELEFDPHANTKLLVDTIVVQGSGVFEMGTEAEPIDATHRARVIFADRKIGLSPAEQADFDHEQFHWDPLQFSHGLLSHGSVSIHGAHVTSFVSGQKLSNLAGSNTFDLGLAVPADWKVGDRLIISGMTATNAANVNQDEEVQIAGINGNVITLTTPLKYGHYKNTSYVADMNRSATFESETPGIIARRGHVMFMHSDHVEVESAGFYGLGRTDKRTVIDDVVLSDDPDDPGHITADVLLSDINPSDPSLGHRVLVPVVDANGATVIDPATGLPKLQIGRTGLNPRGRYAVHFHRTGTHYEDEPATIGNSAVVDSPGWGIVNHSSYVNVTDNVVFNAVGAAFVTEAGDEIGSFDHNLAMHSLGTGLHVAERKLAQDFGHTGDGFWLQGGNVSVTNNVVTGMRHSGYVFFPTGLDQKGIGVTQISGENLQAYAWADPDQMYDTRDVPLKEFKGNVAIASEDGFESWFTLLKAEHDSRTVIENFKVSNMSGFGIAIPYTKNLTFKNVTVTGNPALPRHTGIERNGVTENIDYDHVTVQFYDIGINVPQRGVNNITGGKFNNLRNINIVSGVSRERVVNINDGGPTDPIKFVNNLKPLINGVPTAVKQHNIYLDADLQPNFKDLPRVFIRDVVNIGLVTHNGQQVYFYEQAANFTPFPSTAQSDPKLFGPKAEPHVPAELLNKTNAQLWAQYGLAIAGMVAPANSIPDPQINGIVGPHSNYPVSVYQFSKTYYNDTLSGPYHLIYGYTDPNTNQGVWIPESTPTPLAAGWNLLTRQVMGQPRTFLVYGDKIPPTFEFSSTMPTTINRADLDNGSTFVIAGRVLDDSYGAAKFHQPISLKDAKYVSALKTRADGTQYVTVSFMIHDLADNATQITFDLNVTLTATLLKDIGRKNDPFFVSSNTLKALIG